jgi:enamine deaminase RidA (YjgF/YER057c/UK114 family)
VAKQRRTSARHRRAGRGDPDQGGSAQRAGSPERGASRRPGDDKRKRHLILHPKGWPRPKGYANGIKARGEMIFVGGMVGWDARGHFPKGFVAQARQILKNIAAVLAEGGGRPKHIVRMTWYVLDLDEYRAALAELGAIYSEVMGRHYPAMALVAVKALVEREARLEIEATAVVPD